MTDAESTPPGSGATRVGLTSLEGVTASLLLALASVDLVGYRFGDSNHGITVPILKRLIDPSLYPGDIMVATAERFPTVFYRVLAALLPGTDAIPPAFFALYVIAIAATLAGAYRIGRWFGGRAAGAVTALIAFPVRIGLAGEALYRVAFSHSHLASALSIWAIVFFLEGRRVLALLLLSLGAYNHLLYSAYVLVPLLLVVIAERRRAGRRRTLVLLAAGLLPLVPLAAWTAFHATRMTPEWLELLRLRSSHHSFPSAFGDDLPAAANLLVLGALVLSRLPRDRREIVGLLLAGTALQFVLGTVFTEFLPVKAVLQYQPHRSWRFLMLVLYGLVATGIVDGWRAGGLARVPALVTGLVLIPGLEPLLPVAVFLQATLGRPAAATWARLLAVAVLLTVGGWASSKIEWGSPADFAASLASPTVAAIAALGLLLLVGRGSGAHARRISSAAAAALTVLWLGPTVYARIHPKWERGPWRDVQDWVRLHTPKSAVLVTPPLESGFRVFSERTIVGEWKDGTQQYFDDAFVIDWGGRMELLGESRYPRLPDDQLLAIARRYGASHVVMPMRPAHRGLLEAYRNSAYVVYRAAPAPAPPARADGPVGRAGAR